MNKQSNKNAIILTDGGICSQIIFCILGKYLESIGYKVKYDLEWFYKNGKDENGKFPREYSMDRAFPELNFEIATEKEIKKLKRYKKCYTLYETLGKLSNNLYIIGYPEERTKYIGQFKEEFIQNFNPVDKDEVTDIVNEVESTNSCAVHVRRGDLSSYTYGYGAPPDKQYFLESMDIVVSQMKERGDITFYFFSDEPQWVKENILPYTKYNCKLIDKNDSSKGYLDLYIMSRCKAIIASQGSFGNFAKILSPNENAILITPYYKDYIFDVFNNVIIFNNFDKNKVSEDLKVEYLRKNLSKCKSRYNKIMVLSIFLTLISVVFAVLLLIIILG